jgi:hypothetical protein
MLSAILLGLAQGIRHSVEPDHLAAVSSLIGQSRGAWRSAWLGAVWGIGHTLSLVAVGVAILASGATLPGAWDRWFEIAVGVLLVALGLRALRPTRRGAPPRPVRTPVQALLVGMVHGLAGSSALTALVVASLPSLASRVGYLCLFGFGSIAGMAAVSAVAGVGLQRACGAWWVLLRSTIGLASVGIGLHAIASGWGAS